MRIGRLFLLAVTIALVFISMPLSEAQASHGNAGTLLPDLGMDRTRNYSIETTANGRKLLRFTTIMINIGDGQFQARGHSRQSNGDLLVEQQITNADGSKTTVPTGSRMYFAGDGHTHWHVRDLASYELQNTNASAKRTSEKHGFCANDNYVFNLALPHAPQSAQYPEAGCGMAADALVNTGLSVGWGDRYSSQLPDQYIDITGLPPGEYTLRASVDTQGYFRERCEANNGTTARLRINASSVSVISGGIASTACARQATNPFTDITASPFRAEIQWAYQNGITVGCTTTKFCPLSQVTREQMASFLVRALDLPPTSRDYFTDDESSSHEGSINRLAAAGITGGCAATRFCPSGSVTREQMTSFLARAFKLPPASVDYFSDDDASQHEGDINRLARSGITGGCAPHRFCPLAYVTREQMAAFLYRSLT